eukprot:Lithocolla_globosa_v1_NODE_25_length_9285_cov_133.641170.p5 type:complete len:173 gc:universal NODE_25_length_9285_cov_133.641170:6984-7502(+)
MKSGKKPESVNVDGGSEFKKESLQLLKDKGITVYQSDNTTKVPIVERVIRTMKNRISRYQDSTGSYRYIDALQKLVEGYNSTKHSTIGMSPNEATKPKNHEQVLKNFNASIKPRKEQKAQFKEGDIVRLSVQKGTFSKESDTSYTLEKFRVSELLDTRPPTFRVEDCMASNC